MVEDHCMKLKREVRSEKKNDVRSQKKTENDVRSQKKMEKRSYLNMKVEREVRSQKKVEKNRESTRSWTARVRFLHFWADRYIYIMLLH